VSMEIVVALRVGIRVKVEVDVQHHDELLWLMGINLHTLTAAGGCSALFISILG